MGRQLGGAILRLLTMNRSEHGKFVTAPGELILLRRARARALTVGLLLHTHTHHHRTHLSDFKLECEVGRTT